MHKRETKQRSKVTKNKP